MVICGVLVNSAPLEDDLTSRLLQERMTKQEAKGGYGSPFHKQRLVGKREVDDWLLPENMTKPEESGYGYAGRKQRERYFGKREVNSQLDLAKNFDRGKKMKILVKARSFLLNLDFRPKCN